MLSREEFESLVKARGRGLFSIYLPTHPRGQDIQQDPIRLRNLLTRAQEQARDAGLSSDAIEPRLKPAHDLLNDTLFWRYQGQGLAVFCSDAGCAVHRLPLPVEELFYIGDRFCVRPLLPAVSTGRNYYLLALSRNSVRLFECSRDAARETDLYDIPGSLREAVGYDWEQKSLQFHVGDGAGRAMFHGHGRQTDKDDEELEEFLRAVDRGVCRMLAGSRAPLIVAAVDYLIPMYRRITDYPVVPEKGVPGNPDRLRPDELHARSLECAAPFLDEEKRRDLEVLEKSIHSERAATGVLNVLPAARDAKVGSLFVVSNGPIWGRVGETASDIDLHAERENTDDDLLDLAISYTVANSGAVYDVAPAEMPGGAPVAALLRY